MALKKYDELPSFLKTEEVYTYYQKLDKRRASLALKRIFDFTVALIAVIVLSPLYLILAIAIKLDSEVARSIDNYMRRADNFLHHLTVTEPDGLLSNTFTDGLLGQSLTFFAQAKQLAAQNN